VCACCRIALAIFTKIKLLNPGRGSN
jgi:hypothetical protein